MSRTTDPRQAIQDLLESSDPETVIQYDGITYRVAPSGDKREGFYEILTVAQLSDYENERFYDADSTPSAEEWMASNAETWLRSARYNESLATTTSD